MLAECLLIGFIPTTDSERARKFYVDQLKLEFVADDQFALVVKTQTSMVRIAKTPNFTPAEYTILGWEVPAIAETVKELTASGISFTRYSFIEQDAAGIWTSPSGSKVAWFKDPDGNVLSLSQH
jgi:predicted enzyme related to lactoylglutathione lyase